MRHIIPNMLKNLPEKEFKIGSLTFLFSYNNPIPIINKAGIVSILAIDVIIVAEKIHIMSSSEIFCLAKHAEKAVKEDINVKKLADVVLKEEAFRNRWKFKNKNTEASRLEMIPEPIERSPA